MRSIESERCRDSSLGNCPRCGTSRDQVVKHGTLGCGFCVVVFRSEVLGVIYRFQKDYRNHISESPRERRAYLQKKIAEADLVLMTKESQSELLSEVQLWREHLVNEYYALD